MKIFCCANCFETFEDRPECPHCGKKRRVGINSVTDTWSRGGITLEHVEENPKHFKTKQELRRYCKEKGLSSGALL